MLKLPGPWIELRPALPYVPGAFATKAPVLNHFARVGFASTGSPTTFGLSAPTPVNELSIPVPGVTQKPLRAAAMADTSQSPAKRLIQLPRKCGASATSDRLK